MTEQEQAQKALQQLDEITNSNMDYQHSWAGMSYHLIIIRKALERMAATESPSDADVK